MSIIARLGVILGINTAEFNKGLDDAIKKSREFEQQQKESFRRNKQAAQEMSEAFTKIGIAAAAAGFAIYNAFKKADEISDLAKGFDTTIESLLATQAALQGAGGNAEDVATMFQKLAQAQDGAREGNDALRESFERLGIVGGKVDSLKLDALFKEVAKALSQVDDASERAALAQDLLGKAVKGVNWADFVDKYKEFDDPSLVKAIEQNAQAWEDIEKALKNISMLMQQIAAPIAKMVNDSFEIAKNFKEAEAHQYGIASIFQLMFAPKTIAALPKPQKEATDIFQALPPELADTPMLYGEGGYKKKSAKEIAAAKTAASEAKRLAEEQKRIAEQFDKFLESVSDKEKQVAAELQKILTLGNQNLLNLTAESKLENALLDLELNRHLMSEDTYQIKKKTIEQTKDLNKLTAEYLKFETDARAEMEAATGLDAGYAKEIYEQKMQYAGSEYALKFTNLKSLQEKEIEVIKKTSQIRRQYEKEDRDIAYLNQLSAIDLQYKAIYENLKLEDQAFLLSTDEFNLLKMKVSVIQQIAQIEDEYAQKRIALMTEFARKSDEERKRDLDSYEEQLNNLEKLKDRELQYLDTIQNKREENYVNEVIRQQSWVMGWTEASKQYFEAMEKAANRGAAAFNSMMGNMNSALSNFVETGKLSFEDLAASIIRDLIRIELQAQASKLFGMIWNSISGMFGATSSPTPQYSANVAFRAAGGAFSGPTIVGENGPELLVPNMSGTIIPNGSWQQAAASMGGSGFVNNGTYIANMSAIDTQSGQQFLAKNKNTIWAVYQSANRSVPISR